MSEFSVLKVAALARLDLSEDEALRYQRDLDAIVGYMERLRLVDTSAVPATLGVQPHVNVFREDETRPSLGAEGVLVNAPRREGDSFQIPRILE